MDRFFEYTELHESAKIVALHPRRKSGQRPFDSTGPHSTRTDEIEDAYRPLTAKDASHGLRYALFQRILQSLLISYKEVPAPQQSARLKQAASSILVDYAAR